MKPSYAPKCPNHGCPLEGLPFPLPSKGKGICPVSGCPFDFVIDLDKEEDKTSIDKDGNKIKTAGWKVSGKESK